MDKFVIHKTPQTHANKEPIYIYTDGACIHNGKPNASAGIGVYFGENDPRNISQKYEGKQTNNVAELLAIISAISVVKKEIEAGQKVIIYSDSTYAIRCCTTYGEKCLKNNWLGANKKPVPNVEIVKTAYNFCKKYPNITFKHIDAHTGKQDIHSIGNENADMLANTAANDGIPHSKPRKNNSNGNIYLSVPYSDKDKAKKLGAKWDAKRKKWYILSNNEYKHILIEHWS